MSKSPIDVRVNNDAFTSYINHIVAKDRAKSRKQIENGLRVKIEKQIRKSLQSRISEADKILRDNKKLKAENTALKKENFSLKKDHKEYGNTAHMLRELYEILSGVSTAMVAFKAKNKGKVLKYSAKTYWEDSSGKKKKKTF